MNAHPALTQSRDYDHYMKRVLLILVAAVALSALSAAGQERIPGADEHVTVPGAPGKPNKEILVRPSDAMKQAGNGWILQGERATTTGVPRATRHPRERHADLGTPGGATYVPEPSGPSGPTGPAVVGAAFASVRGTVTTYSKNAITILEKSGRQRQVSLAPRAVVFEGLKLGDEVVLRIPFDEGADCRTADRVERPPAPKAAPKSKFSQAQATGG